MGLNKVARLEGEQVHAAMQEDRRFPIVGVGASAGGIEALEGFLREVEPHIGAAFVVVLHLDPSRPSLAAEILGRSAQVPVCEAKDGVVVEPGNVYVIPPNATLTLEGRRLRVGTLHAPHHGSIDGFLVSLAKEHGEAAIGIVLSGGASDGAAGLRAIKEQGGVTMAQDPAEARTDSMPRSAIALGAVDWILPVGEMPAKIASYASTLDAPRPEVSVTRAFERLVLEELAPPALLVDAEGKILYATGRTGRFFQLPQGMPRVDLVEMAPTPLRPSLYATLHRAIKSGKPAEQKGLMIERDGIAQRLDVIVRPMGSAAKEPGLFAVVVREAAPPEPPAEGAAEPGAEPAVALVTNLELELLRTRESLQTTIEELEAGGEELQSTNEELLSTNEELQSANEELQTSKEDLKRAQDRLARLGAIVESSQDAIIGVGLDGAITAWNAGAERVYGYSAREAVLMPLTALFPPEVSAKLDAARGQHVELTDVPGICKGGRVVELFVTLSPVHDAAGEVVALSVIAHDVSEQQRAKQALRASEDRFLAVLGHELRNPLGPIQNAVHVMGKVSPADPGFGRARDILERQVGHMTHIIDDLLDVGRLAVGKIMLHKERIDIVNLVRATVEERCPDAEAGSVTLTTLLPERPLWIVADPTRIAQSIANLLVNAVKFTPGGGHVAVAVASEPGGAGCVTVSDDGVGIEPEMLNRLFEPFSQADRSIDRSRGGLGLGLSLVRSFVEMHGGSVDAHSEGSGKGSTFTLRLPLAPDSEVETPPPSTPAHPQRVLVVEDNPDAAELMAMTLQLAGHEVAVAHTGASGVEQARAFQPAVVLCDIGLPGELDGYGVARALRADPSTRDARLIALTGYGQEEDKRLAREAGFDDHLTKPVAPEVLDWAVAAGAEASADA